jgi:hypothetical protein
MKVTYTIYLTKEGFKKLEKGEMPVQLKNVSLVKK